MNVAGVVLEDWTGWNAKPLWQLRIPLNGSQYINFFRDFEAHLDPLILSAFVTCVERGLKENAIRHSGSVETEDEDRNLVYAARAGASGAEAGSC